jgi:hypothetical protein
VDPPDKSKLSPAERVTDALNEFNKVKEDIDKLVDEPCPPKGNQQAWDDFRKRAQALAARLTALGDLRGALARGGATDAEVKPYKDAVKADLERYRERLARKLDDCARSLGVALDEEAVLHDLLHDATAEKARILQAYGLPVEGINPKERWLHGACEDPSKCPRARNVIGR